METKRFTQYGKLMFYVFIPIILLSIVKFILHYELGKTDFTPILTLSLILILVLFLVYKLTINISNESVSFTMGIGLIRKRYPISDIKSVETVKNNWLYGWGIRIIPGGWLYNVSGSYAIELRFHSSDKVIRIGTDKPEEVEKEIKCRIQ
jgi:hypothetical protein